METLTKNYKSELLNALSDLEIDGCDFEHQLEDCNRTYAKLTKTIETKNLYITIEFEEEALWSAYDEYETDTFNISDLEVVCENGTVGTDHLTDTELLKHINY